MIDLTPLDVRKKKEDFKKAVRGYDTAQVDTFLDLVADRFEQLVGDHRSLSERVEALREQLESYKQREKALNEALLAAQELREEARAQAERDAAVRLREAETHAEAILLDADQAIRHSQRRMDDLGAKRTQLLRSLRGLVDRFGETLEVEESRLDAEPDDLTELLDQLEGEVETEHATARVIEHATAHVTEQETAHKEPPPTSVRIEAETHPTDVEPLSAGSQQRDGEAG